MSLQSKIFYWLAKLCTVRWNSYQCRAHAWNQSMESRWQMIWMLRVSLLCWSRYLYSILQTFILKKSISNVKQWVNPLWWACTKMYEKTYAVRRWRVKISVLWCLLQIGDKSWKVLQEKLEKDRMRQDYTAKLAINEQLYNQNIVRFCCLLICWFSSHDI